MTERLQTVKQLKHIPRILALDGGGVRGLSSLLILQRLMEEIADKKNDGKPALPCEYFDLICGTSTGGLIALMLGRLRMPIEKCIENYMNLSKQVFNLDRVRFDAIPVGKSHCRFDERELERALKRVIHEATGDEDAPMADPNDRTPDYCPVFVVTIMGQNANDPPRLFRSYGKKKDQCRIWEAARATSAAPTYFPPIHISLPPPGCWYIDGGVKRNNPSEVALEEAREIWKTSRRFIIISIGTGMQETADFIESAEAPEDADGKLSSESRGRPEEWSKQRIQSWITRRVKTVTSKMVSSVRLGGKALASKLPFTDDVAQFSRIPGGLMTLKRFAQELVTLSTNSEDTHNSMSKIANSYDHWLEFPYYRFNVPSGMDKIGLQEWKKQAKIGALTWGYLSRDEVKREVDKCTECLFNPPGFESLPHPCIMVRYERNQLFTGRDAFLAELNKKFRTPSTEAYHGRIALFGLGGIGKTQIAIEYVYRYQSLYQQIYWISGDTQASLLDGYQRIAKRAELRISHLSTTVEVAEQVISWLGREKSWLLVVDNLDDLKVLSMAENTSSKFLLLPPTSQSQHTLITTRNRYADRIPAQGMEVTDYDRESSLELLYKSSKITPSNSTEDEAAEKIVKDLDHLPLAIDQAAAEYRRELRNWKPQGIRQYLDTVATTWHMSFAAISDSDPTAVDLLRLVSFLNPDGILIEFLQNGADAIPDDLRQIISHRIRFQKAVFELERFSLVKRGMDVEGHKMLVIHRLVQAVVKDEMSDRDLTKFHDMSIGICDLSFPKVWEHLEDRALGRLYIAQVMGPLLDPATTPETVVSADVMNRVGVFLKDEGKFVDSECLISKSFEICRHLLGQEHPATLMSMNNLACTYWDQGKMEKAAAQQEEVLKKCKQVQGKEHPNTLMSMNNLACIYWDQDRTAEAAALQEEVLKKCKLILGKDHLDTLISMNNLACTHSYEGRNMEAAALLEDVLEKRKQVLGKEHPHTLMSMNNLACNYRDQDRMGEATALQEEMLEKCKLILGEEHPDTLMSMNNLASSYRDQGRVGEATALQEEVLEKCKLILGEEHPDTLMSMNNLASTYRDQSTMGKAAALQQAVMENHKRVLPATSPYRLRRRATLAVHRSTLQRGFRINKRLHFHQFPPISTSNSFKSCFNS